MLKFIDESDFLKVDSFKENEDGSVSWTWDEGVDKPTHSGIIFEGLTPSHEVQEGTKEVQVGTEKVQVSTNTVVIGQEEKTDENGNIVYDAQGNPVMVDITVDTPVYEEQPVMETQPNMVTKIVNVWDRLWELVADPESPVTVEPVDIQLFIDNAKQQVNAQRDALIHGGITHNGNVFQTDQQSILDIMGAVVADADTQWLTEDNVVVPMTAVEMKALGQAVAAHKETLVYKARVHKDNLESLSTKAEIDDYMSTISWE